MVLYLNEILAVLKLLHAELQQVVEMVKIQNA